MDHEVLNIVLDRLDKLEDKIDQVRAEDLPKLHKDMALMIERNTPSSKLHSMIGSAIAILISIAIGQWKH